MIPVTVGMMEAISDGTVDDCHDQQTDRGWKRCRKDAVTVASKVMTLDDTVNGCGFDGWKETSADSRISG